MNRFRQRLIDKSRGARDGRRMHAFYQGFQARRSGLVGNPHAPGGELHACWKAGYDFATDEQVREPQASLCRFGPGSDFTRDWPEITP